MGLCICMKLMFISIFNCGWAVFLLPNTTVVLCENTLASLSCWSPCSLGCFTVVNKIGFWGNCWSHLANKHDAHSFLFGVLILHSFPNMKKRTTTPLPVGRKKKGKRRILLPCQFCWEHCTTYHSSKLNPSKLIQTIIIYTTIVHNSKPWTKFWKTYRT